MAKQTVNIGVSANDNTGDPLRTAFDKLNDNFDEVYAAGPVGTNITISSNTIASTNTNGNIELNPAGTGRVIINGPLDLAGVISIDSSNLTGNIIPSADATYSVGSSTNTYNQVHQQEAHVGGLILKEVGTQLEIFRADGVTNAILSGNSTTSGSVLNNGNTVVALTEDGPITFFAGTYATGSPVTVINEGNITTPAVVASGNVTAGNLVTSGSITAGSFNLSGALTGITDITATGTITAGTFTDGTATVTAGAVSGVTTLATTGEATLASATVSDLTTENGVAIAGVGGSLKNSPGITYDEQFLTVFGSIDVSNNITATGTVTGDTLTDGTVTINNGIISGITAVGTLASLEVTGNIDCGNVNTTAVEFGTTGIQSHAFREMRHYFTADGSAFGSTDTNVFGVSPNLEAGKFYEFFIQIHFENTSTGNPSFRFLDNSGDIASFNCQLTTGSLFNPIGFDSHVFGSTGDVFASSTLNIAQEYCATLHGSCQAGTGGRLDIQMSVDSGTIITKAGSNFRFTEVATQTVGDVA